MSAGFTPGPWMALRDNDAGRWCIDTALGVESTNGYVIADDIIGRDAQANANLIAAAPELYGLAERAMRWFADNQCAGELAWEIGDALSKARGVATHPVGEGL